MAVLDLVLTVTFARTKTEMIFGSVYTPLAKALEINNMLVRPARF